MSSGPLTVAGAIARPGGRAANSAALEDRSEGDGRRAAPGHDQSFAGEDHHVPGAGLDDGFTTNWLVVGDLATAIGLTAVGFVLGPFVYLGHEMAWEKFGASRHAGTKAVAATSVA